MEKKNIAFVVYGNFDDLTDYIEHTKNLTKKFNIYLISSKVSLKSEDINIIQIKKVCNIEILNKLYFFFFAFWKVLSLKILDSIVLYNRCSFLFGFLSKIYNIFSSKKIRTWYDLRSGSVSGKFDNFKNYLHRLESYFFDKRIAISDEVSELVFGSKQNVNIIGLGCSRKIILPENERCELRKNLKILDEDIVFVYCGTFSNRNLDVFLDKFDLKEDFKIIFIGDGNKISTYKLQQKIILKDMQDKVIFTGRVPYVELYKFYNISDVGICYIPRLKMYEYQPPTKIFEYAEYGLSIIATKTFANEKISNKIGTVCFFEDYNLVSEMKIEKKKQIYNLEEFYWEKLSNKLADLLLNKS